MSKIGNSPRTARAITYTVVALLACAALRFTPPIASRRPAAELLGARSPASTADEPRYAAVGEGDPAAPATGEVAPPPGVAWREVVDTLHRGESLGALLARRGLAADEAAGVVRALERADLRNLPAGLRVTVGGASGEPLPREITLYYSAERAVNIHRDGDAWVRRELRLPWVTDTVAISGTIESSLYDALDGAAPSLPRGARHELAWTLADVFEYRVDMSRDLQRGDAFRVLVERSSSPTGAVKLGRVLAAAFDLQGSEVQAVRYTSRGASGEFFDGSGKSLRAAFLRAPVEFRRISSVFGLRRHPILGVWKQHKGTDYAASQGTPVRSIGDGVVVFAGRKSGYGNVVDVRHRNGYVSRYGHLRGFARGIRPGARVDVGQTIAYVGMTGLATAPHLHFEMLMGGVQRDPRLALRQLKGGEPIPAGERATFARLRDALFASLEQRVVSPGVTRTAVAE
ncbi:MAG: M23 family metallopeptidase [Gemmatimonadaceae bacterium]